MTIRRNADLEPERRAAPGAVPVGANIVPAPCFHLDPTETQVPAATRSICVADNGSPSLSGLRNDHGDVNEVNLAPVLAAIGAQTVDEELADVTASATDLDLPANTLTFSLRREHQ